MSIRSRFCVFAESLRAFAAAESGMTLPLLAVSFMAISGFAGVAVDIARLQLAQSKLSYATDAAGLAAGATLNTTNCQTEVNKYLQVNFPTGYLGAATPTAAVTLTNNNMVINVAATTTLPTTFMGILGISTMTVSATSQVTRTASGLELVMVLDNTGSMSDNNKMTSLKTAATTLVGILTGGQESVRNLWIGLVPFSQTVNIGKNHLNWLNAAYDNGLTWASAPTGLSGQAALDWGGCVDARYTTHRDITDDPPAVETFHEYYFPSTQPTKANKPCVGGDNTWVKTWVAGKPTAFCNGIGVSSVPLDSNSGELKLGPNLGCPQEVVPMTASATTVINAINGMKPAGNTHINLGLAWGWRMLSPNWRNLGAAYTPWSAEMTNNNLPLDYGTAHMNKAVILLTDGDNTMDTTDRTAYGYLSEGNLGTTNSGTAVTTLNTRMTSVCSSLKTHGVYVYTIALGSPSTNTKNLLKGCATADNYYFLSPSSDQLDAIFKTIGDSLSNLRVSQ